MAASNGTYKPMQSQASTDFAGWLTTVENEKAKNQANPTQAATGDQLMQQYGVTADQLNSYSQYGGYTKDPVVAQNRGSNGTTTTLPGTGEEGYYYYEGTQRPVQEGTSGADEQFLSDGEYTILQQLKQEFANAQAAGDQAAMDAAHQQAEAIRARHGYSGGSDGSMYLNTGSSNSNQDDEDDGSYSGAGTGTGTASGASGGADTDALRSLLSQWQDTALKQSEGKIDYAVAKAVAELERALEDAQPQFKEQAEFVAKEERQDLDNSALYAEARGDKGGIGQSQYNEIQAAAAQNHLAVQQAQTKLATDTARQIEDLRAQGEFQKADAALQIAQTYLSELIGLEQWAAEYNLSVDQFNESVRQWEAEFNLAMQQFEAGLSQWEAEFGLAQKQYQTDTDLAYGQLTGTLPSTGQLTLNGQSQLASMGEALLSAGIMPSADQLSAMGMTESQAQQYLTALQLEEAQKASSGSGGTRYSNSSSSEETTMNLTTAKQAAAAGVFNEQVLAVLRKNGYTDDMLEAIYGYSPESEGQQARPVVGYVTDGSDGGKTGGVDASKLSTAKRQLDSERSMDSKLATVDRWYANGTITAAELNALLDYLGV